MKKTTRNHALLIILTIIIQLLFAILTFFIPIINTWLKSINIGELIIGYISLETIVIASGLAVLHFQETERQRKFDEIFLHDLQDIAHSRLLDIHEFFSIISNEVKLCKKGLNMAYLGPTPLTDTTDLLIKRSYQEILSVIKNRSKEVLHYRWITRLTKANWPWILEMCEQLAKLSVFSMSVLIIGDESERNSLALSVQTVDGERVYLVAINEIDVFMPARDLMIYSPSITRSFEIYYERLWSRSILVLDQGRLQAKNIQKLKTHLDSIQAPFVKKQD